MSIKPKIDPPPVDDDQAAEPAQPKRRDLLDSLTIAEIDAGSRELGTSLVRQVMTHGERYEAALAVVLWLHRRRADRSTEPKKLLADLRKLSFRELTDQADELSQQLAADDQEAADPLAPAPA
jgi:hypothetical protein